MGVKSSENRYITTDAIINRRIRQAVRTDFPCEGEKNLFHVSEHPSVFYCFIMSNDEGANAIPAKPLLLPLLDRQLNVTLFRINVIH